MARQSFTNKMEKKSGERDRMLRAAREKKKERHRDGESASRK